MNKRKIPRSLIFQGKGLFVCAAFCIFSTLLVRFFYLHYFVMIFAVIITVCGISILFIYRKTEEEKSICRQCPEYEWNYVDVRVQEEFRSKYNFKEDLIMYLGISFGISGLLFLFNMFKIDDLFLLICLSVGIMLIILVAGIPCFLKDMRWRDLDDDAEYIKVPIWKIKQVGWHSYFATCFINGKKYVYKIRSDLSNCLYIISSKNKSCVIDYYDKDRYMIESIRL